MLTQNLIHHKEFAIISYSKDNICRTNYEVLHYEMFNCSETNESSAVIDYTNKLCFSISLHY
jgi:hypothetical protein